MQSGFLALFKLFVACFVKIIGVVASLSKKAKSAPRGAERKGKSTLLTGPDEMRIAKMIASCGHCSRREAERLIAAGRVRVNGQKLDSPVFKVVPGDRIEVDGKLLAEPGPARLWRYNKPRARIVSHHDPQGRPTVFDALPAQMGRVISAGRLDYNTEGLLLLTNSGELARHLELPATGWVRRYRVRVFGEVEQGRLDELQEGVTIKGVRYGPVRAKIDRQGSNPWLSMSLSEGKNREIKRILEHLGLKVSRLIRISYGPFQLGDLAIGALEEVKRKTLAEQLGADMSKNLGLRASGGKRAGKQAVKKALKEGRAARRRKSERPGAKSAASAPSAPSAPSSSDKPEPR
jgi:23S rRNA pseudouridine2605 synthase